MSSLKFQKPDKKNVLVQIWRNICDSNHGLLIMLRESSTVQRLIPLEIAVGVVAGLLVGFIPLEFIILAVVAVVVFTTETANSAIEEVTLDQQPADNAIYNLYGIRVNADYKGVVIKNGKKMMNR